ncbi:bifunctional 2-C-methyl-D-erythritol 4-phosphate cytidylyltransferase/2-C-methyl-D-erythritol 2,4-cyclodiphosphate synthase [Roseomonas indoligenes]|uniref:Bifunctional enzyme IspD/IspF n=1 Tax=Roseomonas indoligenes TaxID=2820811 RepID=A0A940MY56_9PROT|nr:bifunctional 2-C-methyl-D-erythritol 4-phosphate cytidylyltransferase/2-C-methyl-D-erythritol 2,4-cyclodiphosphate synthase [Pararoseomonas indoligenes]MBP0492984.1 bifunctional 2-C-methyl-D-erythritol 4-phosphate cytidylyltransferase/2-C-methyl-D-erythritol 2,4-cyclodiphosphate synthase [Pararoseomonas indoligenes]
MRVAALLMAAGRGERLGAADSKQFLPLLGRPVLRRAAEVLLRDGVVDVIQPVCAEAERGRVDSILAGLPARPAVAGGATRQESVRAGLEALAAEGPELVLVHDAARPVVPAGTVAAVVEALAEAEGAIPAQPVADTLKLAEGGAISRTVPREGLHRAQTPQGFRFPLLLALHRAAPAGATDDASLLEAAGHAVRLVPGSEDNVKITYPGDLERMEAAMLPRFLPRVGTGFDVHRLVEGRKLFLCGVEVPHSLGLDGHSDADVGLHALCDAIYGALAEGDIGRHFPPSQMQWKDADSTQFLIHAASRIAARGGVLANADITLICERPKITPHAPAMIARVAELMGVPAERVSVKATTTERLGFPGREEGIAAQAAVSILVPA